VTPAHAVSPLEGLRDRTRGLPVKLQYDVGVRMAGDYDILRSDLLRPSADAPPDVHGLRAEYFANMQLQGTPVLTRVDPVIDFNWGMKSPSPQVPDDHFSARWSGILTPKTAGRYQLVVRSDDGARVYLDNRLIIDDWREHGAENHLAAVTLEAGHPYAIRVEYFENTGEAQVHLGLLAPQDNGIEQAAALARRSDVAIVFAGWSEELESEGLDRASLSLPARQDRLIEAVAKANPRTIVVLNSGGSELMPWLPRVAAVVQAWYGGEQGGNAIADLLLGRINPSGKLPVSFYRRAEDASSYGNYPGKDGVVRYAEGIFVGYRHLDRAHIAPLFPFGYGLSYTRFALRNLKVKVLGVDPPRIEATVDVTNVGKRAGSEVVQLYVHEDAPVVPRPVQELKGFSRITLQPGQSGTVKFVLDRAAFAYYDVKRHQWTVPPGRFTLRVGCSSRDIRLQHEVVLH